MLLFQWSPGAPVDGREGDRTGVKGVARVVLKLHRIRGRPLARRQHLPRLLRHLQQIIVESGRHQCSLKPSGSSYTPGSFRMSNAIETLRCDAIKDAALHSKRDTSISI